MLKAIELSGFKSFADRTRLEFEDGISALVGPNGSGKSNIVDAIKWVLGEQSMKKLRGSEATDVIFSGSAERAPLGSAEVTLTFDNSKGIFKLDTPLVHITRRVYRSGEGEYLINRQASRLRDIKDLLSGTGLGTQAYSIIEQGRVESLLQSSPVQRRVIFEESAGISRFNAQKQKTQTSLERVDQNLVRLGDIVSEVDHSRRMARNQAGKAQLYRQYADRLRELRIQVGLADFQKSSARCTDLKTEIERLSQGSGELADTVEENERSLSALNTEIESIDQDIRRYEGEIAATRQKIAGEESTIELQFAQIKETDVERHDNAKQLAELNVRSVDMEDLMRKTTDDIRHAKRAAADAGESYQTLLRQGETLAARLKEKRQEKNTLRKESETQNSRCAALASAISGLESKLAALESNLAQSLGKRKKQEEEERELTRHCEEQHDVVDSLASVLRQKQTRLEEAKQRKNKRVKHLAELSATLSDLKQKQSGMRERISVLEELIRKHEGLSPGVKEVLRQSRDPKSPFRHVFGLVADLLQVDVESAPLIEAALGANAQHLVVSPKAELFRHIQINAAHFAGRVGFIWLSKQKNDSALKSPDFSKRPGVLGRADGFVNADPKFAQLAEQLLGRTWIVENFDTAVKLFIESDGRTSFLTLAGEHLDPNGALIVGPPSAASGIISRRSELRTLGEQMAALDSEVSELEISVAVAAERVAGDETDVEDETQEYQKAVKEFDSRQLKFSAVEERRRHAAEQLRQIGEEIEKLETEIRLGVTGLEEAQSGRKIVDEQLDRIVTRQEEVRRQLEESENAYAEHQRKTTNAKIELAKIEDRLEHLNERIRQFEDQLQERQKLLAGHHRRDRSLAQRRDVALLSILRIESDLAHLYIKKETDAKQAGVFHQKRNELALRRSKIQADLKKQQHELTKLRSNMHTKQIDLERLTQERKTLLDRMKDDYGIDLEKHDEPRPDRSEVADSVFDPKASQKEIEDLRNKLQRLGSVNLEAVETLDEVEARYNALLTQYNDLTAAKRSIEKIIEKINVDSQRLFEETFEGVRHHFRELFQQLFGGGSADLVLENPENMLESGVDIVAKPPGKELKSVMLLSGGEKTMTCVALLLAFFRYRPNPVCILDECDAALDEGNIDRFVNVIKEFRTNTQFLMITHSKKTMAAATTMYGVTMQESGVSKPVSVRFAEVDEQGNLIEANPGEQAA